MPAAARPRYFEKRNGGGWFILINGRQRFLGKHPENVKFDAERPPQFILDQWHKVDVEEQPEKQTDLTTAETFALYLADKTVENPKMAKRYEKFFVRFMAFRYKNKRVGDLLVNAQLDKVHLQAWLDSLTLSQSTRFSYGEAIKGVFRWAVKRKNIPISVSPFADYTLPPITSRKTIVPQEEFDALLKLVSPEFGDLLSFVRLTGCRTGEARKIEARHVTEKAVILQPHEHKTGRKTGKPRVIALLPDAAAIVHRLAAKNPEGIIFRTERNKRWTDEVIYRRLFKLREEKKIRPEIRVYALRHSFITNAMRKRHLTGLNPYDVGKLVGNSLKMIERVYDHSGTDPDFLLEIAAKAK